MAVDKEKLLEEASFIRFCKIVLGWDYFTLLDQADVTNFTSFYIFLFNCQFFLNENELFFLGFCESRNRRKTVKERVRD